MNNFTTDERIEQFSNLMNPYVSEEFKEWLIESGFFTAPASIHHHGAYSGALFDHSFAVTKALLSFTERLELKWQLERSPLHCGYVSRSLQGGQLHLHEKARHFPAAGR